jgi:hypothetical protein
VLPKRIFEKKIEKCKKGDEITPFDGIRYANYTYFLFRPKLLASACVIFNAPSENAKFDIFS